MWALSGLFFAAFIAASLFPAQSEGLLAYLTLQGEHEVWLLVTVATLGNVLGSCTNYWLGRLASVSSKLVRLMPSEAKMCRARSSYQRFGRWSLLLSWLPVVGDPLTLVAGVMRENIWVFLTLVTIAKLGRYIAVAYLAALYI